MKNKRVLSAEERVKKEKRKQENKQMLETLRIIIYILLIIIFMWITDSFPKITYDKLGFPRLDIPSLKEEMQWTEEEQQEQLERAEEVKDLVKSVDINKIGGNSNEYK